MAEFKIPLNRFDTACKWAADLDYTGVQVPSWDARCIDLKKAASSKAYCDDLRATAADAGVEISELSTHLQGQLVGPEVGGVRLGAAAPHHRGFQPLIACQHGNLPVGVGGVVGHLHQGLPQQGPADRGGVSVSALTPLGHELALLVGQVWMSDQVLRQVFVIM